MGLRTRLACRRGRLDAGGIGHVQAQRPHRPTGSSLIVLLRSWVDTASTISPVRVAVLDIGSNSTRLLIAEVDPVTGAVEELLRHSKVTRLGDGVDSRGKLSERAIARVLSTLAEYREAIDSYQARTNLALLTSYP